MRLTFLLANHFIMAKYSLSGKFSNVAIRKPTVQSSTFSNYFGASSHAVDGNSNNQYYGMSCTRTEEEQNPWWRVDLQKETEVFEVKVVNRGDCCGSRLNGFEIRVGMLHFLLIFRITLAHQRLWSLSKIPIWYDKAYFHTS